MVLLEKLLRFPFASRRKTGPFSIKQRTPRPLRLSVLLTMLTAVFTGWLIFRRVWQPSIFTYLPFFIQEMLPILELAGGLTIFVLWLLIYLNQRDDRLTAVSHQSLAKTVDDLYALSPFEFEAYVGAIFRKRGYRVKLRGKSGDLGVDIEVRKANNKKAVVQCKRYRSTVGPEIVRELYGTMIHERAAHAFLVTTADISASAHEWARNKPMTLIDGKLLAEIAITLENGSGKR